MLQEPGAAGADHRQQVADDRGGGLLAAGAGADQDHLADRLASQHDRVERALDRRQRMVVGEQARVHAGRHAGVLTRSAEAISLTE